MLIGDGIEIVEGVAGAGKTYALAAARYAWEASGHQVTGCSLAARAARHLQDDAGIPSSTLDRLLGDLDRNRRALDEQTVVVVDESAMVGTRKLTRLLDHAATTGAKVVLVGDPCQLPEIDAGGAFRGLRARLGANHLTDNRRQADAWERAALADLRHGDPSEALNTYDNHQRVGHAGDSQPGVQFKQRSGQALVVLVRRPWHHVEIAGLAPGSVGLGGEAADEQVLDAVSFEDGQDADRIETGVVSRHVGVRGPVQR